MSLLTKLAAYNKFIIAVLGAAGVTASSLGHAQPWIATVVSILTAASVYLVPNKPAAASKR